MPSSRRHRRERFVSASEDESESISHHKSRMQRHLRGESDDFEDDVSKRKGKRKISEEEIAEYLAKKVQKKAVKVSKILKPQTISGYSNDSNPCGDSNLNEKFVWKKKIERDVNQGIPLDEFSIKAEKKRHRERMAEIEKVKKRREERAVEKAQQEEEMLLLARERARAEFQDWEKKEEEAYLKEINVKMLHKHLERLESPVEVKNEETYGSLPQDEQDFDQDVNGSEILSPKPLRDDEIQEEEAEGAYSPQLMHGDETEDAIDPEEDRMILERKRIAVKEEKCIHELALRPAPPVDNFENNALRAMGATEEGDAVFGSNNEINLDSQAFRVVNKEWEYSHKKGFKCTFEREILHVYFNFTRYRYRR